MSIKDVDRIEDEVNKLVSEGDPEALEELQRLSKSRSQWQIDKSQESYNRMLYSVHGARLWLHLKRQISIPITP